MRKIKAYNLDTRKYNEWSIPSLREALDNHKATFGKQYDRIEREVVEGGIPLLFNRV